MPGGENWKYGVDGISSAFNYIHKDPVRSKHFIKLHPHLYFSDYDVSIWIDADIQLSGEISGFIEAVSQKAYLAACSHPQYECVFEEITACVQRQEADSDILLKQQARYKSQSFPKRAGLWLTDLLVRRHNDRGCIRFELPHFTSNPISRVAVQVLESIQDAGRSTREIRSGVALSLRACPCLAG